MFNCPRFGQLFINKVANPKDMIIFQKKRLPSNKIEGDFDKEQFQLIFDASSMDKTRVEDLVKDYFDSTEGDLKLAMLSDTSLGFAVTEFVDKCDKDSIDNLMKHVTGKFKKQLSLLEITKDSIAYEIRRLAEERNQNPDVEKREAEKVLAESRKPRVEDDDMDIDLNNSDTEEENNVTVAESSVGRGSRGRGSRARGRTARAGATGGRGGRKKADDGDQIETVTQSRRARGTRSPRVSSRGTRGRDQAASNTLQISFQKQARNGKSNTRVIELSDSDDDLFPKASKKGKANQKTPLVPDSDSDF